MQMHCPPVSKRGLSRFPNNSLVRLLALGPVLLGLSEAPGLIVGPYSVDSSTLHLWHLNEGAAPALDSVAGGTSLNVIVNGAVLSAASYSGFGTALNTLESGATITAGTNRDAIVTAAGLGTNVTLSYMDPSTFAFTYEAIVRIDWDPTLNLGTAANGGNGRNAQCQIIDAENNSNPGRIFQLRIDPIGTASPINLTQPVLEFINVHATSGIENIQGPIPVTGPDAIVQGNWYHVAVTYNGSPGTADNIKLYWTLLDPSRVGANLILSTKMNNNLLNAATVLALGNIPRTPNANFLGLIDEVRISKTARTAGGMMFTSPDVIILTQPVDTTNAVGQTARLSVSAAGAEPIAYQWRHAGNAVAGATQAVLTLANAQMSDGGVYDVVITNATSAATSAPVTLTVRQALNLLWTGQSSFDWDYASVNWTNLDNSNPTNYTTGDNVRFDNSGVGSGIVNLTAVFSPSSVTVDSDADYDFLTLNSAGTLTGSSQLTKSGSGKLILEMNNSYSGPTVINSGSLQLGLTLTVGAGSMGTGPVTNNGALLVNRSGNLTVTSDLYGTGTLTVNGNAGVALSGTNAMSGDVTLNAGALALTTPQAHGNFTNVTVNATANSSGFAGTRFAISSGMTFGPNVALSLLGTTATPDFRTAFAATSGTNNWNGPIVASGSGACQISSEGGTTAFNINAPINATAVTGSLLFRGGGYGSINGTITAPDAAVNLTDNSIWVLNSTGNQWTNTTVAAGRLIMGANNVLPANVVMKMGQGGSTGILDLNGFNQQILGLVDNGGIEIIASSSTTSDATLTLNTPSVWTFGGNIQDSISNGTRKVALTLNGGGTLTLRSNNTYSGQTTISAGTLALSGVGAIPNSATIFVASGATVDVSARTDAKLTVGAAQTLRGSGAFNVNGSLGNNGTIELNINKSGATLSNDSIQGLNQITYGGTLKLDRTGDALTTSDSFKLFYASSYAGSFSNILPPTPGPGLIWNISTLTTDGTLRVATAPVIISSVSLSGTNLILSGSGGTAGQNYSVLSSTNVATPLSNWVQSASGVFDSNGNFSVINAITPGVAQSFFMLRVP